jgi:3-dehydroquinate dehydratase-2
MARAKKPLANSRRHILVLHGPNLDLLGTREPAIYGADTLEGINSRLAERAQAAGFGFFAYQSNFEGELIVQIGRA